MSRLKEMLCKHSESQSAVFSVFQTVAELYLSRQRAVPNTENFATIDATTI